MQRIGKYTLQQSHLNVPQTLVCEFLHNSIKLNTIMQNTVSNHFFEYDFDKGIVLFSKDTNDVGKFVEDVNIFGAKLKDCKTDFFHSCC